MSTESGKSELRYSSITPELAPALQEIEWTVFHNVDREDLYHADGLEKLARLFPEGNFVVFDGDRPVGMGLGVLVDFDFGHASHAIEEAVGDDGVSKHDAAAPWYYGTSIAVYPEYRGRGIGGRLYELRKECVRLLNKQGIVAGGLIPGYGDHKDELTPHEYVAKVVAGELYDATLTFQLENGFEAPGAIDNYMVDPTVNNAASLIVWHNPDYDAAQ